MKRWTDIVNAALRRASIRLGKENGEKGPWRDRIVLKIWYYTSHTPWFHFCNWRMKRRIAKLERELFD